MVEHMEELRRQRHDLRHQLTAIQGLTREDNAPLRAYLDDLLDAIPAVRRDPKPVIWINAIYLALQSLRNIVVVVKLAVKTVSTVSNVRRVYRQQNPLIAASKFLSYADTLASIVILIHTANLKYAAGGLWSFFLLGAGIGVRLVIFALGVYMIVQSQKLLKAERKRRESGFSEE